MAFDERDRLDGLGAGGHAGVWSLEFWQSVVELSEDRQVQRDVEEARTTGHFVWV